MLGLLLMSALHAACCTWYDWGHFRCCTCAFSPVERSEHRWQLYTPFEASCFFYGLATILRSCPALHRRVDYASAAPLRCALYAVCRMSCALIPVKLQLRHLRVQAHGLRRHTEWSRRLALAIDAGDLPCGCRRRYFSCGNAVVLVVVASDCATLPLSVPGLPPSTATSAPGLLHPAKTSLNSSVASIVPPHGACGVASDEVRTFALSSHFPQVFI